MRRIVSGKTAVAMWKKSKAQAMGEIPLMGHLGKERLQDLEARPSFSARKALLTLVDKYVFVCM
jgi:hypothetical protein